MRVIWKYELTPPKEGNTIDFEMPVGATILDAQIQGRAPVMWAAVDPENPKERRTFYISGTGHPIEDFHKLSYVATFQLNDAFRGSLVFHIFEVVLCSPS